MIQFLISIFAATTARERDPNINTPKLVAVQVHISSRRNRSMEYPGIECRQVFVDAIETDKNRVGLNEWCLDRQLSVLGKVKTSCS